MHIEINSDNHIKADEHLAEEVRALLEKKMDHFQDYLTRIEVHLSDENSKKAGQQDKRCLLEARFKHHQPVVASDQASSIYQAAVGAADKLKHALANTIGRLSEK